MKRLADIVLPDALVWREQSESGSRAHVSRTDLAGRAVLFRAARRPRVITLEAGDDYGWIDAATRDALLLLAATGTPPLWLEWGAMNIPVAFHGDPAIALRPLWPGHDQYHIGTITLIALGD